MSSPTLPSPNKVSAASCLSGRSFKTETCVFLTYCLGIFQFVAFALALRALGFAQDFRAKGKSRISMSSISLSLLALIIFDFQQQKYWDLVFLVPAPNGGVPIVKLSPFTPQGGVLYFGFPPNCVAAMSGVGSWARPCLCLFYPPQCISLYFVVEVLFI